MLTTQNSLIRSFQLACGNLQAQALYYIAWAIALGLLGGCATMPPLPNEIIASAFLPDNGRMIQFETTSQGDTQPTLETWIAQSLETENYSVAMTNEDEELILYILRDDGLYTLYPQANTLTLILPNNTEPGTSWTDADGVISTLIKQFYYKAPNGERYPCIEIQVTYPPVSTDGTEATQTEYYAQGLGLIKVAYNDLQNTVKEISAINGL